jgi:AraC-like DNA-binding protein
MGLLEYIHFQKAESAKRLLTELDATPSHVARLLGFSDARYFAKFFLREVGVTPSQYRTLKG